ncbi:MAG TPA: HAD family phosphatase [Steroidobacteraceae bacterium]|nr:HAD family phosphatase [Steroidobacteraceae bacterium]
MPIKNVVFDVGQVLLEWNPAATIARLHPDPAVQAVIRRQMFEHADWHEFDRGGLSYDAAIGHFAKATGLTAAQTRDLIHATREALVPIPGTVRLVEDLAAAGVHLYLLSNMPASTYDYLAQRHAFFSHFEYLVISGQILLIKPDPAIFGHLVEKTGIVPAESVFIDDLAKNIEAARACGFGAIQFTDADSCRRELRSYLPAFH